jgi:hypothetical protein
VKKRRRNLRGKIKRWGTAEWEVSATIKNITGRNQIRRIEVDLQKAINSNTQSLV